MGRKDSYSLFFLVFSTEFQNKLISKTTTNILKLLSVCVVYSYMSQLRLEGTLCGDRDKSPPFVMEDSASRMYKATWRVSPSLSLPGLTSFSAPFLLPLHLWQPHPRCHPTLSACSVAFVPRAPHACWKVCRCEHQRDVKRLPQTKVFSAHHSSLTTPQKRGLPPISHI
jgi:hypothetical protein